MKGICIRDKNLKKLFFFGKKQRGKCNIYFVIFSEREKKEKKNANKYLLLIDTFSRRIIYARVSVWVSLIYFVSHLSFLYVENAQNFKFFRNLFPWISIFEIYKFGKIS